MPSYAHRTCRVVGCECGGAERAAVVAPVGTPMTPDLDAIRERLEAITPGPWERCRAFNAEFVCRTDDPKESVGEAMIARLDRRGAKADAIFIAAAPTDVAALLAEVERLQAEAALSRDAIDTYVGALAASNTEVKQLRNQIETLALWLTDNTDEPKGSVSATEAAINAIRERDAEVTRLRPMEAALAAARELHAPVTVDDLGLAVQACRNCCINASGYDRTSNCEELHLHGPGRPICPTRAALDGGA